MYKYFSTNQFAQTIRQLKGYYDYHQLPYPTDIKFKGTVKLHGTNTGVYQKQDNDKLFCQSRNNNIAPGNDHMGFAFFIEQNKEVITSLMNAFKSVRKPQNDGTVLIAYGEWFGKGVMKKVAVSEVDKTWAIFRVGYKLEKPEITIASDGQEIENYKPEWFTQEEIEKAFDIVGTEMLNKIRVYNMYQFGTYEVSLDLNNPGVAQNELVKITTDVENECPAGKFFGVSGVGEGVVWICQDNIPGVKNEDLTFKVKGEKHSVSKVKSIAEVDIEKFNSINTLVDAILTENRLEQGIDYLTENHLEITNKSIGAFLKWVSTDCIKEERERMEVSNLEVKDVMKVINQKAKQWIIKRIQTETFGIDNTSTTSKLKM